jgi:predicted methyltransferase
MFTNRRAGRGKIWLAILAAIAAAQLVAASARTQDYAAVIAAPDRSDADREADKLRDPVELLAFIAPRPGMKVLDMGAGAGYSTELMARAVGLSGMVYGQNPPDQFEPARQRLDDRLKTPAMKSAAQLLRPFDDPVPADVHDLDLITFLFFYHDTTYLDVDRARMNRRLFDALKPGGTLVIADYSARPGDGASVGKTLHRIEESALRREVEAAGFKLAAEGDFLRHPEDKRDTIIFRAPKPLDEFILKFEKPR